MSLITQTVRKNCKKYLYHPNSLNTLIKNYSKHSTMESNNASIQRITRPNKLIYTGSLSTLLQLAKWGSVTTVTLGGVLSMLMSDQLLLSFIPIGNLFFSKEKNLYLYIYIYI